MLDPKIKMDLLLKSQELRESLGEDVNSPIDVFALVNQIDDLTLVFYPFGDNISGMCIKDKNVKMIAINSAMSYGRQRFSLAHELYHLFYDDQSGFNVCAIRFDPKSKNEKMADQFASYFLTPPALLRKQVEKLRKNQTLSLPAIIRLEQFFGISHLAMLWRLVEEGILDREDVNELSTGVTKIALALGYDDKLYKPTPEETQKRTLGHYLKQVELLKERDLVSDGKIDELLLDAFRDDLVFGNEEVWGGYTVD